MTAAPYRTTPLFDERSLPPALRRDHSTKAGVWGLVRVIEGSLRLEYGDGTPERTIAAGEAGLILPQQPHRVEPLGPVSMQVEFYDRPPPSPEG